MEEKIEEKETAKVSDQQVDQIGSGCSALVPEHEVPEIPELEDEGEGDVDDDEACLISID